MATQPTVSNVATDLLASAIVGGRDDFLLREIVKIMQSLGCSGGLRKFVARALAGLPQIVVLFLVKYYLADPSIVVQFLKKICLNLVKQAFYREETFSTKADGSLDYFISKEVKAVGSISVNLFTLYASESTQYENVTVAYIKGIHSNYIQNLKSQAQEALEKSLDQTKTSYYKYTSRYTVQSPASLFPSRNYTYLESVIRGDIETGSIVGSYPVMGILIDGEPGLGKSSFAEYIAGLNLVGNVYRVDLSGSQFLKATATPASMFESVFHSVSITASSIFMIDEMDKYLAYYIEASYRVCLEKYNAGLKPELHLNAPPPTLEEHSKQVRTDFLYALLEILERTGLTKSCVVLFCSNNFDTILDSLETTHFLSIIDRFIRIPFERCDNAEVCDYMRHYNAKFAGTRFHQPDLEVTISRLREDVSITYRTLHQIAKKASYDFRAMVTRINQTENSPFRSALSPPKTGYPICSSSHKIPIISAVEEDEEDDDDDEDDEPQVSPPIGAPTVNPPSTEPYDYRQDPDLDQEIRDLDLSDMQPDETDPDKYVCLFRCQRCKLHFLSRRALCECDQCLGFYKPEIMIPGEMISITCHDCQTGNSHANQFKIIAPEYDDAVMSDFARKIEVILDKSRDSDNKETRKIFAVLTFKFVSIPKYMAHINHHQKWASFRKTVIKKVAEFYRVNPGYMTANQQFFSEVLYNFLPVSD